MYGRKRSRYLGAFLSLLSLVYGLIVSMRAWAYTVGLFRTRKLSCRVVSVGNITVGGTGKTPAVINIAGLLREHGQRPLVLSRGYGRADASSTVVVSDGVTRLTGPDLGGDEPALIAGRLSAVPVVVGSDRARAGSFAVSRFQPDCVILDDGYQHLGLRRDLNIALVDACDPFGNGKLIPAGILREPLSALSRADIVVMTRADQTDHIAQLEETIRRFSAARIFTARYVPRDLMDPASGKTLPPAALQGSRIFTFAGIARPGSLDALVGTLGATVVGTARFPDHHPFTGSDIEGVKRGAAESGASMIVTTEKDAVRLADRAPEGIWALRIDLEVIEQAAWEEVLAQ